MTTVPNWSSSPIDFDKDTGGETIQKEEKEHTDAEDIDLDVIEKTTI